ncbi:ras-related protein Rab-15 [Lingula anatina]|uniref:Ras-related protein Rab-15 n=1 Tax=Lingula anatina TaxID=7574 RepID=A0A1S3JXB5_LINAN|nr:ras-related protein Rab-15 [Lingula anatina]|eukprot:XP_013414952.1 ras-related protein Rab-15 [Lingula anatina]
MAKQYDVLYKVLLVGDSGVGKTCLICRFAEDEFHNDHLSTIGIDFKLRTILSDDLKVRIQVWDTAGQERYETITKQYYRRAQGVFLVYDITNPTSFYNITKWLNFTREFADSNVSVMLLGNKSDKAKRRKVTREQGIRLARDLNIEFCETSAKSRENIDLAFASLAQQITKCQKARETVCVDLDMYTITNDTSQLIQNESEGKNNWCCVIL